MGQAAHSVLSGAVTADNMDYVRRDAYMCGVSLAAVDVPRLIYYSFCSPDGLTFHKRALNALRAFLNARFYMYENVYFHRIGHAIDLHMREIFSDTMDVILPTARSTPAPAYRRLAEWSLLFTEVERSADNPVRRRAAPADQPMEAALPPRREVPHPSPGSHRARRTCRRGPATTRSSPGRGVLPRAPARRPRRHRVRLASSPRGTSAPLNPMTGPKRRPHLRPRQRQVDRKLLTGILAFVPAKAHLYRVFATTREHDRELADAARRALTDGAETSLTNL